MFDYNTNTQHLISRGILHTCHDCDKIIEEGAYINNRLYCPECVKEYFYKTPEQDLLEDISEHSHWTEMAEAVGGEVWEK